MIVDPDGEWFFTLLFATLGAYLGGRSANSGENNPLKWDYQNPNTWFGMGGGAIIGGAVGAGFEYALQTTGLGINLQGFDIATLGGTTQSTITAGYVSGGAGASAFGYGAYQQYGGEGRQIDESDVYWDNLPGLDPGDFLNPTGGSIRNDQWGAGWFFAPRESTTHHAALDITGTYTVAPYTGNFFLNIMLKPKKWQLNARIDGNLISTTFIHFEPLPKFPNNGSATFVYQGSPLGHIPQDTKWDPHLHLEMMVYINGRWMYLDPAKYYFPEKEMDNPYHPYR